MRKGPFTIESTTVRAFALKSTAELAIIVVGILLALTADDWWTERQERTEELEILGAISRDIAITRDRIQTTHDYLQSLLADLRKLSEGSSGPAATQSDLELARMLNALWDSPPISVQMSAYEEVKNSGRLRLIGSAELRRALAEYDRRLQDARQQHAEAFQNQHLKLDPYLIENVQLSQIASHALHGAAGSSPLNTEANLQDHHVLLDDRVFKNQVVMKYIILSYYFEDTGELLAALGAADQGIDARVRDIR